MDIVISSQGRELDTPCESIISSKDASVTEAHLFQQFVHLQRSHGVNVMSSSVPKKHSSAKPIALSQSVVEVLEKKGGYLIGDCPEENVSIVCIDIDKRDVTDSLQRYFTAEGHTSLDGPLFFTETPRGCHFYFQKPVDWDKQGRPTWAHRNQKHVTVVGFEVEWISKAKYTFAGAGYSLGCIGADSEATHLATLPLFLYPSPYSNTLDTASATLVPEGSRNSFLYKTLCASNNSGHSESELRAIANFINHYVLEHPLPNNEVVSTLASACHSPAKWGHGSYRKGKPGNLDRDTILSLETGAAPTRKKELSPSEKAEKTVARRKYVILLYEGTLGERLGYDLRSKRYYSWEDNRWLLIKEHVGDSLISNWLQETYPEWAVEGSDAELTRKTPMLRDLIKTSVPFIPLDNPPVPGLAYRNGYLRGSDFQLHPHDKKFFVTSAIDLDYPTELDENCLPDREFFEKLSHIFCEEVDVNLFRTQGYRVLFPDPSLHTGYVVRGPTGAAKSLMLKIFFLLFGNPVVKSGSLAVLTGVFSLIEYIYTRLMIVDDQKRLAGAGMDILSALVGRGPCLGVRKNIQETEDFIYEGTVTITTNTTGPEFYNNHHGLIDRLFPINVKKPIGLPNAELEKYFMDPKVLSKTLIWYATCPKETKKYLVRTGDFNDAVRQGCFPELAFALGRLVLEPGASITREDLVTSFCSFDGGVPPAGRPERQRLYDAIINWVRGGLNLSSQVTTGRFRFPARDKEGKETTTRVEGVKGVRLANPKEIANGHRLVPSASDQSGSKHFFNNLSPFEIEPTHPLHPFQEKWVAALEVNRLGTPFSTATAEPAPVEGVVDQAVVEPGEAPPANPPEGDRHAVVRQGIVETPHHFPLAALEKAGEEFYNFREERMNTRNEEEGVETYGKE